MQMISFQARCKAICILLLLCTSILSGCATPQPGPDKTVGGAILGAGWGAGAGAVVGHQIGHTGPGVAVGSGFGLVDGALTGLGHDQLEDQHIKAKAELDGLKIQNTANLRQLAGLQQKLDRAISQGAPFGIYQVFFDTDATSLRSGAIANLEAIGEMLKRSPYAYVIKVAGHTDDTGLPDYNERLAQARAKNVAAYLAARGISVDQIVVENFGAKRPIASNSSEVGRQLNRRVDVYIAR